MALEREDLVELLGLAARQLDELQAIRVEAERQRALLEQILGRLESIERTQYS